MNNLVLYRKYRPQNFSEMIGQEHIVKTLENALSLGMISHAYLFTGPRGSGKTTMARLLAKALNCNNRKEKSFEPCGKCPSCLEIKEGRSLDLIELDAASNRGIDEIRELRDGIKFAPAKEKYKVFVIDECHQLTKEAANALLKTLEEPPSHAIFILATTEIQKMIPTIISRCQRFDFRKLTVLEIIKRLEIVAEKEGAKVEKSVLELIAINSGGAIRDAESLLGQVLSFSGVLSKGDSITAESAKEILGMIDSSAVFNFIDLILEKNGAEAIAYLGTILEGGKDPQEFSKAIIRYLRQLMVAKMSQTPSDKLFLGLTREEAEKIKLQAGKITLEQAKKMIDIFLEADSKIRYSSIPQLPLELAVVETCLAEAIKA